LSVFPNRYSRAEKQGKETSELENEIDRMVYDLYELIDAERQIVRELTALSSARRLRAQKSNENTRLS